MVKRTLKKGSKQTLKKDKKNDNTGTKSSPRRIPKEELDTNKISSKVPIAKETVNRNHLQSYGSF